MGCSGCSGCSHVVCRVDRGNVVGSETTRFFPRHPTQTTMGSTHAFKAHRSWIATGNHARDFRTSARGQSPRVAHGHTRKTNLPAAMHPTPNINLRNIPGNKAENTDEPASPGIVPILGGRFPRTRRGRPQRNHTAKYAPISFKYKGKTENLERICPQRYIALFLVLCMCTTCIIHDSIVAA